MRVLLLLAAALLAPSPAPVIRNDPISGLERFELEVVHWEGSFGTYMFPGAGQVVVLDLGMIGSTGLLTQTWDGVEHGFDVDHLKLRRDRIQGDASDGWYREVLLEGRELNRAERTLIELTVSERPARWEERDDGRRVALNAHERHVQMRAYTLRDDDTLREYGRARASGFPAGPDDDE